MNIYNGWRNKKTVNGQTINIADAFPVNIENLKIEGLSSQLTIASGNNKVVNGNFVDTSNWNTDGATISASANKLTVTSTKQYGTAYQSITSVVGRKYYASAILTANTNQYISVGGIGTRTATSTARQKLSMYYTATATSHTFKFGDNRTTGWTAFTVEQAFVVDLTALFGAGKEPLPAWCDINLTYDKVTNGTPSPTSSSTIYSSGDEGAINVWEHKKNLFNSNLISNISDYVVKTTNGLKLYKTTSGRITPQYNLSLNANTNYYFSCDVPTITTTVNIIYMMWITDIGTNIMDQNLTVTNNKVRQLLNFSQNIVGFKIYIQYTEANGVYFEANNIQVEVGTSATTYEPYEGNEYSITLDEPLRSLPNGVKDTIDNGVLTRRVGKVVLNGSESGWQEVIQSSGNANYYYAYTTLLDTLASGSDTVIKEYCNNFKIIPTMYGGTVVTTDSIAVASPGYAKLRMMILKSRVDAMAGASLMIKFKAWLASNNVTVLYELATPTTENVTVPSIDTFEDYTIISTTNTVKPTIEFQYTQIYNFNNNGYGFLKDAISVKVTEVLNGGFDLAIEYPLNGFLSEYLVKENIIKCNVGNDNYQTFRIKYIETTDTRINVYAVHIFYDLADNMLIDVAPENKSCQSAVEWLLARTQYVNDYTVFSDIVTTNTQRYVRRNPVEALIGDIDNSIIKNYGAELERNNKQIKLLSRRGADNHVKVLFGKNIKQIKITEDVTAIYTRIMPMGANGLLLPELFVDSPLLANYIQPKIAKIEFNDIVFDPTDEDAYQNVEDAYTEMRNRVNQLYSLYNYDKPAISVLVSWIELSKIKEYYDKYSALETVNLGDTITVEYKGFLYSTRIVKTIYNVLLNRIETFEMGIVKPSYISSTATKIDDINKTLSNPANILQQAKDNATSLITSAMGGYVYKTQNELMIMDTNDVDTAIKVWRWNLNGLAYSSTGVNGTYEIAITQDGSIVADMITSGTLDVGKIGGLSDSLNGLTTSINLQKNRIDLIAPKVDYINEDGSISNVVNDIVSITDEGMVVTKEGEAMSSLVDNTGLYVYRDKGKTEEVTLLTVNNTGVVAENVTVNTYLTMGNIRIEEYEDGIGFFYTGV